VPIRHQRKNGRPTKRTKAVLTPLFAAIRIGVPYKLACMAAGITYECFLNWRQKDPEFDRQVEQAAAEPAVKLFKTIREQAPETWQAGAWALERRYPEMFAKPEAQLNIVATAQAAALGPSNVVVIGPERARLLVSRHEQLRANSIALLDARVTNTGNGQGSVEEPRDSGSEPVAAVVPAASTDNGPEPSAPPQKPSSWWAQFVRPVLGRPLPRADAVQALKLVLAELRIPADPRLLDFQTEQVAQSVFCRTLEQLTGSDLGWRQLCQIYEREQARERLWADH
jgi:hypothetical protein